MMKTQTNHPFAHEIDAAEYRHHVNHLIRCELRRVALLMRAELDSLLACDLDDQSVDDSQPTVEQRRLAWDAVNEGLRAAVAEAGEIVNERLGSDAVDAVIAEQMALWQRGAFGRVGQYSEDIEL